MLFQVYDLSNQFLPKEWIMAKWEEGFYITAMAGSTSGSSLVVMSKGTPYTQQSYKVCEKQVSSNVTFVTLFSISTSSCYARDAVYDQGAHIPVNVCSGLPLENQFAGSKAHTH